MNPKPQEETLFAAALALAAEERAAFLDKACVGDSDLRRRIEILLTAHGGAAFLEEPAAAISSNTNRISPTVIERPGDRIGRYKLLQQIGEGGCGVVYMAEQEEPVKRQVAFKIIKLGMDTKQVIARFEAERQALALMDHPNIAKVLDGGTTETGRPYFVMELVRGIKVTEYCDQNNISTQQRLELFLQVCRAVQHAHSKGIIHRDLKPSNILVTSHDGVPVPKVIDFGIAKATQGKLTDLTLFTAFEQFMGTPAYMSPEQAEMSGLDIDIRSDIYSLGVLLYELLTGQTPFDAGELIAAGLDALRQTIREKEPDRPSTKLSTMVAGDLMTIAKQRRTEPLKLISSVRGDLDWIVMKCLEKDRSRRYETANDLAADLHRHLNEEPVEACPPSKLYEFQKMARRHKVGFAATTIVILTLVAGVLVSAWQAVRATRAEKEIAKTLAQVMAERNEKEQARKDAEAIAQFLGEVFRSPDPRRDGREIKVVELLDKASKKLETDLSTQPAQRVKLQEALGKTYHALGLARQAIPLQEKVRDYRLVNFGPEHPDTLGAANDLSISYDRAGRTDEAIKLGEESLTLQRKLPRPEEAGTLGTMGNLAVFYAHAGRLDEAITMQEKVLSLSRTAFGPEHEKTLLAMNNLATSYIHGRLDEALRLAEEALTICRKTLGTEHEYTLLAMNTLAHCYDTAGRKEDAFKLAEEYLPLCRKILGPEHSSTLGAMGNLAICYAGAGSNEVAFKLFTEVLPLFRKLSGPEHPDTLTAMSNLADACADTGRMAEALELREEVLSLYRKVLRPEHPVTLEAVNSLAWLLSTCQDVTLRNPSRAVELAAEAVRLSPKNADFAGTLGIAQYRAGDYPAAVVTLEKVLGLRKNASDAEEDIFAVQGFVLAMALWQQGDKEQAYKNYTQALASAAKASSANNHETQHFQSEAAAMLGRTNENSHTSVK